MGKIRSKRGNSLPKDSMTWTAGRSFAIAEIMAKSVGIFLIGLLRSKWNTSNNRAYETRFQKSFSPLILVLRIVANASWYAVQRCVTPLGRFTNPSQKGSFRGWRDLIFASPSRNGNSYLLAVEKVLAEREGFEPPVRFPSTLDFEDHRHPTPFWTIVYYMHTKAISSDSIPANICSFFNIHFGQFSENRRETKVQNRFPHRQ